MRWTWYSQHDGACWDEVFPTPEAAVDAMAQRQGEPASEAFIERMARAGLHLAIARVTVEPVMVLSAAIPEVPKR